MASSFLNGGGGFGDLLKSRVNPDAFAGLNAPTTSSTGSDPRLTDRGKSDIAQKNLDQITTNTVNEGGNTGLSTGTGISTTGGTSLIGGTSPVTNAIDSTVSGPKTDFGLTTLQNQKDILSGTDALTASLFSQQEEVGAARAASARGRAGQEAEVRGLSETQEAGAVAATERDIEGIRQAESASLSQQALANARQAGKDIIQTEAAIKAEKQNEYDAFVQGFNFGTDDITELQQKYVDAFGGTAPTYSQLVDDQLNANESNFGAEATRYLQTQGYNIGNIPAEGVDTILDKKLQDLYGAQFGTTVDPNNLPAGYDTWRKNFLETTTSSENKLAQEQALAEKEVALKNQYPDWDVAGSSDEASYNAALDAFNAETADATSNGWVTVKFPDGTSGFLDDNGIPVGLTGYKEDGALDNGYFLVNNDDEIFVHVGNQNLKITQDEDGVVSYQEEISPGVFSETLIDASESTLLSDNLEDLELNGVIKDATNETITAEFNAQTATVETMNDTLSGEDATTDDIISAVNWGLSNIGSMTTGEKRDFFRNSRVVSEINSNDGFTGRFTAHGDDEDRKLHQSISVGKNFVMGGVVYTVTTMKGNNRYIQFKRADGTGDIRTVNAKSVGKEGVSA